MPFMWVRAEVLSLPELLCTYDGIPFGILAASVRNALKQAQMIDASGNKGALLFPTVTSLALFASSHGTTLSSAFHTYQ